jgi:DNA modification methylase
LDAESVDAIVCDPPYGLSFMGKDWDHGVPGVAFWREALRVAKPGAHLVAFGGTRTYHRLAVAIEDAGWEIRDCLSWLYGSGFPKSLDVSKAMDAKIQGRNEKQQPVRSDAVLVPKQGKGENTWNKYGDGAVVSSPATDLARQWQGWGTALKPAWEPVILARKPLIGTVASNVAQYGTGGINVDATRISSCDGSTLCGSNGGTCLEPVACRRIRTLGTSLAEMSATEHDSRVRLLASEFACALLGQEPLGSVADCPSCHRSCDGPSRLASVFGQAFARLPVDAPGFLVRELIASHSPSSLCGDRLSIADDLARIVECAYGKDTQRPVPNQGRWPANVVLDEEAAGMLDAQSGNVKGAVSNGRKGVAGLYSLAIGGAPQTLGYGDTGGASRFFYVSKASRKEREAGLEGMPRKTAAKLCDTGYESDTRFDGQPQPKAANHHPTVKPIALMRWLCRLVTPKGGLILDPFTGSGTTGCAAVLEGFRFVGVEREPEYAAIAEKRIAHWAAQTPDADLFTEAL